MSDALSDTPLPGIARLLPDASFQVPAHQREYSWTGDEIKQLFDDIEHAIQTHQDSYFLGLLVFLQTGKGFTILDGQQRLATVVIIFAAIRDWLNQYSELKSKLKRFKTDISGAPHLGQPNPRLISGSIQRTIRPFVTTL